MDASTIDGWISLAAQYGWPALAIIGSPYIAYRLTQCLKLSIKKFRRTKPNAYLIDVFSWLVALSISYYAWLRVDEGSAVAASFVIACLHTGIVKALFKYAPKPITEILQEGVYVNGDKTRLIAATVIGYGGVERRERKRAGETLEIGRDDGAPADYEMTRVLTAEERGEITGPKE